MVVLGADIWSQVDERFHMIDQDDLDPPACDLLAMAFYNNDLGLMQAAIDRFSSRVPRLWIYVSEPTTPDLMAFVEQQGPGVHFFGDAVPNRPCERWTTVISWFVSPVNWYATKPWAQDLLAQLQPPRNARPFRFDCLLGQGRVHRHLLWQHLIDRQDRSKFFATYYQRNEWMEQAGVWQLPGQRQGINSVIMADGTKVNRYALLPVDIYNKSWYSIVAETTCYNQHNQYTEKVAKPMVAKRPFIACAGQHYLRNLRQLGFRTFSPVIDESYDLEPDLQQRVRLIVRAIDGLMAQDPIDVYRLLRDVLDHNQHHFLETDWWAPARRRLDLEQLNPPADAVDHRLPLTYGRLAEQPC